jgi:membrane associated rhomboid family serine protease
VTSLVFLGFFYQLIDVPAVIVLGFWFVLQLIDGLISLGAVQSGGGGVAFFAHIGGFVVGAVMARLIVLVSHRMRGSATPPAVG